MTWHRIHPPTKNPTTLGADGMSPATVVEELHWLPITREQTFELPEIPSSPMHEKVGLAYLVS